MLRRRRHPHPAPPCLHRIVLLGRHPHPDPLAWSGSSCSATNHTLLPALPPPVPCLLRIVLLGDHQRLILTESRHPGQRCLASGGKGRPTQICGPDALTVEKWGRGRWRGVRGAVLTIFSPPSLSILPIPYLEVGHRYVACFQLHEPARGQSSTKAIVVQL